MLRIGCGAGFSADRLDPACDLVARGALDYVVFECVGERTLAFGHRDRRLDPRKGYNSLLEHRMRAVLPLCREHGTRLVTNMGAANPRAAAEATARIARELGLDGLRIACVEGDDVTALADEMLLWETGGPVRDVGLELVGANAYLGIDAIIPALEAEADVVIAGRVADPSLFLAPIAHRFGWALAEVDDEGRATITKLPGTGGAVTARTVKEQMLYEVHDPARYLTPDVTADFAGVTLAEAAPDRVELAGADGSERPAALKVTVGFDGGFLAEAGVSYAGPNAQARARLARDVVEERMWGHGYQGALRLDLIGVDLLPGPA